MNYHYLDSNNQSAGPAALEEIRALAREGKIASDPMVCPVGASQWKLLSALDEGAAAEQPAATTRLPFSSTLLGDVVARLVKVIGTALSPGLVEKSLGLARHFGQYAVLLGGALGLLVSIIGAVRTNSFGMFVGGLIFVVALAVAQFAASRFLTAGDALIASTPSRLSSLAFLECMGLLAVLAAAGLALFGVFTAIQVRDVTPLIAFLLGAVFFAYVGAIALHPELASVEAGSGSAGEEAIGLLAFLLKTVLKIVPLFFALLAAVGALVLLVSIVAPNSRFVYGLSQIIPVLTIPGMSGPGLGGIGLVLTATMLPLLAYFWFLIASLPLELWRAILAVPGKLDALRR